MALRQLLCLAARGATEASSSPQPGQLLAHARCLATVALLGGWRQQQPPPRGLRAPPAAEQQQLRLHEPPAQLGAHAWQHGGAQQQQRRGMFIQTQPTPNPQSLMFLPGRQVMESGSYEFPNARAAMVSPLAKKLFLVDGVTGVFFGSDFVTVTRAPDGPAWAVLKPDVFAALMDHFTSGAPLFTEPAALAASDTAIHEDDDEVVAMIKELLETRIRPAVQEDGGDIVYKGWCPDSGTVTLKMMGACSGCPSSSVTLKSGIENMLMHYIPEVKQVVQDLDDQQQDAGGGGSAGSLEGLLSN